MPESNTQRECVSREGVERNDYSTLEDRKEETAKAET